jgi:hypothetical protein
VRGFLFGPAEQNQLKLHSFTTEWFGAMPIRLLLEHDHSFGPEEIVPLISAFENALSERGLTNREDPVTLIVAKRIIQFATQGERDHVKLREEVVKSLSK